jgi:diguanylate cyclase (GGDEF)-like protein
MSGASAFFILIPAIYVLFALALVAIALADKRLVSARWAALGFAVACASILVDGFRDPASDRWSAWFAVVTHFAPLLIMVQAFLSRHRRSAPMISIALVLIASIAVMPNMPWAPPFWMRGVIVQIVCAAIIISGMPQLWQMRRRSALDKVVFAVITGAAISYVGRMIAVMLNPIGDTNADVVAFYEGLNIVFHSASALMGMSVGIMLVLTIGFDLVRFREKEGETDTLTGLGNRKKLARRIAQSHNGDRPIGAVIVVDLDHFKRVNDSFGHESGDIVLAAVAKTLRHHFRKYGTACRIGGEEFVALIDERHADAVSALSLSLRKAISELSFDGPLGRIKVTASVGFHRIGADATIQDAIHCADQAVYCAKTDGRDRVVNAVVENGMQLMKAVA